MAKHVAKPADEALVATGLQTLAVALEKGCAVPEAKAAVAAAVPGECCAGSGRVLGYGASESARDLRSSGLPGRAYVYRSWWLAEALAVPSGRSVRSPPQQPPGALQST